MKKKSFLLFIPVALATVELSIILPIWGYIIFASTFLSSLIYVMVSARFKVKFIETPLFMFFILSIIFSTLSEDGFKSLAYSVYWFFIYTAILTFLTNNSFFESSKIIKYLFALILLEISIRMALIANGSGNGIHSVASLTAVTAFLILGWQYWGKKAFFVIIMVATSSLKIFAALIAVYLSKLPKIILAMIAVPLVIKLLPILKANEILLGKIWHLNGRTTIWTYLIDKFLSLPITTQLTGLGYHIGHQFELHNRIFYNAHNIFVSLLLNNGIIGFALICMVIIKRLWLIKMNKIENIQKSLVVIFIINSLANSSFLAAPSLVGFLGLAIVVMTNRKLSFDKI